VPSTPENLLKLVFGYDRFKPFQREVIENVLQKRDTLAIMPTGTFDSRLSILGPPE
jgi:ATP-dependent DNA helicase RecQ